jgi:quinoprotein glucose dehydrogenase
MLRGSLVVIALVTLAAPAAWAQNAPGAEPYATDLAFPTNMAFAPDGRLFFTEKQTGAVRVIGEDGRVLAEPFVTVPVDGSGETGLLGIALHPDFAHGEPWVYLYLTDPDGGMNAIARVRADGDRGGAIERLLETVPGANAYHNGGDLLFGPDGMLYASVGEAHQQDRAQAIEDLGGKVLRLTDEGEPAPGNPFGDGNAVYSLGHRNSFGLCVDPATGDLWETENGPERDDEVNRIEPGANYGWPLVTGTDGDGQLVDPVAVFGRTIAITGCAWWRDQLFVGAYNDGRVRTIDPEDGDDEIYARFGAGVTDLQVGPDGWLYVATENAIWRLSPDGSATDGPGDEIDPETTPRATWKTWVALGAAVVLGGALVARRLAGRGLRDEVASVDARSAEPGPDTDTADGADPPAR